MGALIGQGFGTWQSENDLMDQYYSTYKEATTPEQINSIGMSITHKLVS